MLRLARIKQYLREGCELLLGAKDGGVDRMDVCLHNLFRPTRPGVLEVEVQRIALVRRLDMKIAVGKSRVSETVAKRKTHLYLRAVVVAVAREDALEIGNLLRGHGKRI